MLSGKGLIAYTSAIISLEEMPLQSHFFGILIISKGSIPRGLINDTSPAISRGISKGDGIMFFVPPRDGFIPVVGKPPIRNFLPLDFIQGHCIFPCTIKSSLIDFSDYNFCCKHGQRKRCALALKTLQCFQWQGVLALALQYQEGLFLGIHSKAQVFQRSRRGQHRLLYTICITQFYQDRQNDIQSNLCCFKSKGSRDLRNPVAAKPILWQTEGEIFHPKGSVVHTNHSLPNKKPKYD